MGDRLKGKVALVTGSGRGIGRGEALALASEGAKVVVNDLGGSLDGSGASHTPADEVVAEIRKMGGKAVANYDSVATMKGGENIVKAAIDAFGRLDILVNNAGILRCNNVFKMTEKEWNDVIKVHLYGHFFTIRHACVIFYQQRSGRIINTSSTSGLGGFRLKKYANYSAAKEGIIGLKRRGAREMGEYGVTCNAIRPGAGTRMTLSDEKHKEEQNRAGIPEIAGIEGRSPEDIGSLVVWLASDDAAHVNGRTFFVTTGRIAIYSEPIQETALLKVGGWTIDELFKFMPTTLVADLSDVNAHA